MSSFLAAPAPAQTASFDGAVKSVEITRAPRPPLLDGRIDEEEWAAAARVEDLHQSQPAEYAPPSEATRVYVMYDDDALYVAGRMFDREPDRIAANVMKQGETLIGDDRFNLTLDPFHDRRSGYVFQVNPNGVRRQALYENVTNRNFDWKGIWHVRTSRDDEGWSFEAVIPFKTLSFDPGSDTWGVNFERNIKRRNEVIAWSTRNRQINPSTSGELRGLTGIDQGLGLDVVSTASVRRERRFAPQSADVRFEPSVDVFYKLTPSLTAALTANTDFSATEVDERQVNLTRFNLFFPEKRAFFLQDADIFEFGRFDGRDMWTTIPVGVRQNGRPFFSRQIGMDAMGQPVDLRVGGKLTGRVGRWNVGVLDVQQAAHGEVESNNLFVGRAVANVLEESSVGLILTNGDPRSNLANSVAGVDFRYRNTRLPGGRLLESDLWYQQSDTEGVEGDDAAFGAGVRSPNNNGWRGALSLKQIEANFNPALGFVNRRGIRDYNLELGYIHRRRGAFIQRVFSGVDAQHVELLDGGLSGKETRLRLLELESRTGDHLRLRTTLTQDVPRRGFQISRDVTIAPGDYRFDEHELILELGDHRPLSGIFTVGSGDFYAGERDKLIGQVAWRPSPHFALTGRYELNDIDLPEGRFMTRLMRLKVDLVHSPTLSWSNFVQYDNVSDSVGINSRVHWVPEAGRESFLVLNYGLQDRDEDRSFRSEASDLVLQVGYTFRY